MRQPHPAMRAVHPGLEDDLAACDFIQRPMPLHPEEAREARLNAKEVLKRRPLDDMTSLDRWEAVTEYAHIEISARKAHSGSTSLKFTAPTRLPEWPEVNGRRNTGRIYTVPKAMLRFDRENWEEWNRLSVWIHPDMPGFRSVCLRIQLHNDGEHKVPDVFDRDGGHNINLTNHEWNHVTVEIPYVYRDQVVGLSFDYDMVGNENLATATACWYIDEPELQLVEPEVFEGWTVGRDRIAFSHAGYQPGGVKTAMIGEDVAGDAFEIVEAATGRAVYSGRVEAVEAHGGLHRVCDFTALQAPGRYFIKVGGHNSRVFPIDHRVWMSSIWKTINFFFCQRCGFDVPGKHIPCHRDYLAVHGDKSMVANGGWHDAADMSQQFPLTVEATHGMFELAMKVRRDDPLLYRRLLDEGRWGLQYLLNGRFGDGFRNMGTGTSVWTDGIFGTCDDLTTDARNHPYENVMAAAAEVMGHWALCEDDPTLAAWSLRCAREDYAFAMDKIDEHAVAATSDRGHSRITSPCQLAATVSHAAALLYRATGDEAYARDALHYGGIVVKCQQKEIPDWDVPVVGFFWREPEHRNIIHYNHRSHEQIMSLAMVELCKTFPAHEDWIDWYSTMQLHARYVKQIMEYAAPWGMLPNSIYCADEIDDRETFGKMHPIHVVEDGGTYEEQLAAIFRDYDEQLKNGVRLSDRYYLRRMPVWYSFRGNYSCTLSLGKAAAAEAAYLGDYELYDIAQQQFQWIIGKNPFTESTMYGEGYDYGSQYAVLPGEVVGELPVGMESRENRDDPFWPQVSNATYKEVWVAAPAKWLWAMADAYLPARARGLCPRGGEAVFRHVESGREYRASAADGRFDIELPAGTYEAACGGRVTRLTAVPGGDYRLDLPWSRCDAAFAEADGVVTITVRADGSGRHTLKLLGANLTIGEAEQAVALDGGATVVFRATVDDPKRVWTAALLPDGDPARAVGIG